MSKIIWRSLIALLLLSSLTSCRVDKNPVRLNESGPHTAEPGVDIGNGGDFHQGLFEQGRLNAVRVLERITPEYLTRYGKETLSAEEIQWFFANKTQIGKDIIASKHVWRKELPQELCSYHSDQTCGCTKSNPGSDIYFSYSACSGATSVPEVGQLILHEALHHFLGSDEKKIYRIASVIYGAWSQSSFQTPQLILDPHHGDDYSRLAEAPRTVGWTGSELMVWKPQAYPQLPSFFNPATKEWRLRDINPGYPFDDCQSEFDEVSTASTWVGKYVVVMPNREVGPNCKWEEGRYGIVLDTQTLNWKPIKAEGAPARIGAKAQSGTYLGTAGNQIVFLGFNDLYSETTEAAFYDVENEIWTEITPLEKSAPYEDYHAVAWAGERLVLWAHRPHDGKVVYDTAGLIYDPGSKLWTPMNTVGSPSRPSYQSSFLSLGKKIFTLSADTSNPKAVRIEGGIFDPLANQWQKIDLAGVPAPKGRCDVEYAECGYDTHWDGTRVTVLGKDLRYYYPEGNRWVVSHLEGLELPEWGIEARKLIVTPMESFLWNTVNSMGVIFTP